MADTTEQKTVSSIKVLDLKLDVTEAAALNEPAEVAVTVHLPDPAGVKEGDGQVVCFGKPGGGYSRGYYTVDLPGPAKGAQAQWHAERGWIFVSVDHLNVGESSKHDGSRMDFTALSATNHAAEEQILQRLRDGTLLAGYPKIVDPLKIGIGQSMGGCMTIIQQGRYHDYDGIGILGYSAVHTHPPNAPGSPPIYSPWWPRDRLSSAPLQHTPPPKDKDSPITFASGTSMAWGFHYSDVDPEIVHNDLARFDRPISQVDTKVVADCPAWGSMTYPTATAQLALTPGTVAPEAAAVMAPVLVAMGERDVIADPRGEPRGYLSAGSVDLFICPRMGHMHNFASTREIFWRRLEIFVDWAREFKRSL